ncbi:hypothetical protein [Litchfieldia alkalitelluris]|uniref:hypothetical protein n=1 Tax=Litchfieldia alkalitelluris TaxID=304268 RepID=UPI0009962B49|nr:hypothetical protein [Litchfieldia alkalitelluris]
MIMYHGSIREFEQFTKEMVVQNFSNDINTIGFWFTSDIQSAKPYAKGTETVFQKSETEFWEDGEPKVVECDKEVNGFIYKVYMDDPNLKEYQSYDLFMSERDNYCDYFGAKNKSLTWKDQAILLNKEEANSKLRKNLIKQGYEGFVIRNTKQDNDVTDLYCIFSEDSIHIANVVSVDVLQ